MIGKIIALQPEIRSADHGLTARIDYVAAKATCLDTPRIPGGIDAAAAQMAATCQRHRRNPRTAFLHMVLSWQTGEDPSDEQALVAARRAMGRLGAQGHEAVIGVHRDTDNIHVHTVFSRVHPISGRLADQWQDYARLELACREIESVQGWAPDNGRFAVTIDTHGDMRLVPHPPEHWARKRAKRHAQADIRQTDIDQARSSGHIPLHLRLPIAVMATLRQGLETAQTWAEVLVNLGRFGLGYRTTRRGAVIHLRGGSDAAAVSRMLPGESHARLVARLGPMPDIDGSPDPMPYGETRLRIRDKNRGQAAPIAPRTASDRVRIGALHASLLDDPHLREAIFLIDLTAPRRIVRLRNGGWVADRGDAIDIGEPGATQPSIKIALRMIAARGWTMLDIASENTLARDLIRAAADRGIATVVPPDPSGAPLQAPLRQAADGPDEPVLPPAISAALAARAKVLQRNEQTRTARSKKRQLILGKAEALRKRLEDDLGDLPPNIRKKLLRATQAALREHAVTQTDLRRGLTRATALDLLAASREITPERMTLEAARDLHHRLREAAQIDPKAEGKMFGDLLYPRPHLCLLAHRDAHGDICGYEFAAGRGQAMRAGLIAGSRPTFGLLPTPKTVRRADTAASLLEALAMLPEALRTGTQLASRGCETASAEAWDMFRTRALARTPPGDDLPREPDG